MTSLPHNRTRTSIAAALSVEGTAPAQQQRVYAYAVHSGGATREEIAVALGLEIQSVCPRVKALLDAEKVYESSETRATRTGRQARVVRARLGQGTLL